MSESPGALSEMKSFSGKLKAAVSVKDVDALINMMETTTAAEGEVAEFINFRFRGLVNAARRSGVDSVRLRHEVKEFREVLLSERQRLIQNKIGLHSIV